MADISLLDKATSLLDKVSRLLANRHGQFAGSRVRCGARERESNLLMPEELLNLFLPLNS
jgi:hypothetical protein